MQGGGNRNVKAFSQCTNEETSSLQDVSVLAGHRYQSGAEWTASHEAIIGNTDFPWVSYLHDPIPVVSRGYSEERQKGHPKVSEGGVPSQPLTGVSVVALCGTKHSRETPARSPLPPLPPAWEDSPRSPNSSTPRAANMKNNNMKRRPRFPTWKEKKKWGGKKNTKKEH